MKTYVRIILAAIIATPSAAALACASCGCSLSSDWDSQGLSSGPGLRFDLRYDFLNQNQIRSGSGKVGTWPAADHEQELYTKNQYLTAGFDYSASPNWGVSVQLPYIDRSHATNGFAFDGSDAGTSHTHNLGDIKVIGRYTGLIEEKNFGIQFGLKLPTGSHTENFSGGAITGAPLDRGLQPGTGTTDAIVGIFKFAPISQNWDYFAQATAQVPMNSRDDYKPGNSLNVNLGIRYMGLDSVALQLQINGRVSAKDSGENASPDDSGGKTIYLSPGVTVALTEKIKTYGFIQLPIYQNLNGYQLAPKYTVSVGTRFEF
ncbi:TonB-dependent receptor [Duganella qianjiadongensis]|uniref:TonB-dependent receptor n=1 Tax=Duganella qianjiadongensis TaxID=2692176 RepID=A0ABW9VS85_9BURK|nr:TonB-dependent receptor [Duganella qianjiadongensis]MYM41932.1 TonB-dependent receptor [Duganella qianjiadongensis]